MHLLSQISSLDGSSLEMLLFNSGCVVYTGSADAEIHVWSAFPADLGLGRKGRVWTGHLGIQALYCCSLKFQCPGNTPWSTHSLEPETGGAQATEGFIVIAAFSWRTFNPVAECCCLLPWVQEPASRQCYILPGWEQRHVEEVRTAHGEKLPFLYLLLWLV